MELQSCWKANPVSPLKSPVPAYALQKYKVEYCYKLSCVKVLCGLSFCVCLNICFKCWYILCMHECRRSHPAVPEANHPTPTQGVPGHGQLLQPLHPTLLPSAPATLRHGEALQARPVCHTRLDSGRRRRLPRS